MSTIQTINIKNASSSVNNIVLGADGSVTSQGTIAMATPFAMRNKIINGAMEINQRAQGTVTLTAASQYTFDRWVSNEDTDGTMTVRSTTNVPVGFKTALFFETGTADASLGATQYVSTQQVIEGVNIVDLFWGNAAAKAVTLSFWVRSSLTGTFGGSIRNGAADRSYPFTYTISSANTYEYKTITIPGDTTGTWATDTTAGMSVIFGLGVGSTYSGTANAWQAGNFIAPTGAVSVIGTASANFYLTGVQLEIGSTATPFERRIYSVELAMCQRYYYKIFPQTGSNQPLSSSGQAFSATSGGALTTFPVTMRASPTAVEQSGTAAHYGFITAGGGTQAGSGVPTYNGLTSTTSGYVTMATASGLVSGNSTILVSQNAAAYIAWSAEL